MDEAPEVNEVPPRTRRGGRREKYPYSEWFGSGKIICLTAGEHFNAEPYKMCELLRRAARNRNVGQNFTFHVRGREVYISPVTTETQQTEPRE
jgi:hypothetical protein